MKLAEFDYHLPPDRIAQEPLEDRAASRMLVLDRQSGRLEDRYFRDLPAFLAAGDCLVMNDSKVVPSRLFGHRAGVRSLPIGKKNPARREYLTRRVEVLLLEPVSADARTWRALVRPGKKMRIGERIRFEGGLEAGILAWGEFGERTVRFAGDGDIYEELARIGHMPLPPYIKREDRPGDRERYQTIFARESGSVAAPTAGLHFTREMLKRCRAAGADLAFVTLHVGLGTFQPIRAEIVEEAVLHEERFSIGEETAARLRAARRLVAVGTTAVRTLETAAAGFEAGSEGPDWRAVAGRTSLFIYPGFRFRATGALLTNFHLPRSSLLILVCAFAGRERTLAAYEHAVREGYRFFSYGDCMLIV